MGRRELAGPGTQYQEAIVTAMAPRILELIRRNPDLVRYLEKAT